MKGDLEDFTVVSFMDPMGVPIGEGGEPNSLFDVSVNSQPGSLESTGEPTASGGTGAPGTTDPPPGSGGAQTGVQQGSDVGDIDEDMIKAAASTMQQLGVISEIPAELKDVASFTKMLNDSIEAKVSSKTSDLMTQLEEVKKTKAEEMGFSKENLEMLEAWKLGLEVASVKNLMYLRGLTEAPLSYAEGDSDDVKNDIKENQKEIIVRDLQISGMSDPEIIKATLLGIENQGELTSRSSLSKTNIQNHINKVISEVKENNAKEEERRKENSKLFYDSMAAVPSKDKTVAELLKNSNRSIEDVIAFMSAPSVSIDNSGKTQKITKFQEYSKQMKDDPAKWVIQALLMMNDYKLDFITNVGSQRTAQQVDSALSSGFRGMSRRVTPRIATQQEEGETDVIAF